MRSAASKIAAAFVLAVGSSFAPVAAGNAAPAQTRLVVIKVDGLPQSAVDAYVTRTSARTGRSVLPWIRHLFYDSGVQVANFYSRGISLSEPSWAIIDTGQHSVIKGNFEVDRNTGDSADHLSFVGFYVDSIRSRRVYPAGVEGLDAVRIPLTSDAWQFEDRDTGIQLLRRGTLWFDLLKVGVDPARRGTIGERLGDLIVGVKEADVWAKVSEDRFLKAVRNPRILYADIYWPYVDEAIHDDNSESSILGALQNLDRMLGRTQEAIALSGSADRTVLVVVSDHGATFDREGLYSQGINLIGQIGRPEFGAHHSLSRGGPLANYDLKGSTLNPLASGPALTTSRHSIYLADRPEQTTCAIDYDGNERAQIHFRDPDLNRLQMLWRSIRTGRLDEANVAVAGRGALAILDRRRAQWKQEAAEIDDEVGAIGRRLSFLRAEKLGLETAVDDGGKRGGAAGVSVEAQLTRFSGVSALNMRDPEADRIARGKEVGAELYRFGKLQADYAALRDRLITRTRIRTPEEFAATPEDSLFGLHEFGRPLLLLDLVEYPVRLRDVIADADGGLDERQSFESVDYLELISSLRVRNSGRSELSSSPVSWLVAEIDVRTAGIKSNPPDDVRTLSGDWSRAFVVHRDRDRQILMLYRVHDDEVVHVELIPVSGFEFDRATGQCVFRRATWRPDLPFELFEDASLETGGIARDVWLSAPHSVDEWRNAAHRTREGLAIAGLTEVYSSSYRRLMKEMIERASNPDQRLLMRLELRRRDAVATDLFLHASPRWNFDLKDFNPGGNHGGFGRESMRSVLWMRGGERTRILPGPLVIENPQDGLDVAPTLFEAGGLTNGGALTDELRRGGYRDFPGRVIREAFRASP